MTPNQQQTVGLVDKHWRIWAWKQFSFQIFFVLITIYSQTLGVVLEYNCSKNDITKYEELSKNTGGHIDEPVGRSCYSCKSLRLWLYGSNLKST